MRPPTCIHKIRYSNSISSLRFNAGRRRWTNTDSAPNSACPSSARLIYDGGSTTGEEAAKATNRRPLHPQFPQTAARLFLQPSFQSTSLPHTSFQKFPLRFPHRARSHCAHKVLYDTPVRPCSIAQSTLICTSPDNRAGGSASNRNRPTPAGPTPDVLPFPPPPAGYDHE